MSIGIDKAKQINYKVDVYVYIYIYIVMNTCVEPVSIFG